MFSIIRGGCFARHPLGFVMDRPNGISCYVLLIIKSYAELEIGGERKICKPDSALLIKPNTPYSYKNPNGEYVNDWIHFSCTPEDILKYDGEMFNTNFLINNTRILTAYIQQILWENSFSESESKEYYADSLFGILLDHLYEDFRTKKIEEYSPYKYKLQKLRMELQSAPYKKYTAKEAAEKLMISISYFQCLYKRFFKISFQADIINMRLEYAKELIGTTAMPLEQIACSCGYTSKVHFYRQFLSKVGMTPGEYRDMYL